MKILGKVGEMDLPELFVAGITKQIEERALSPIIGNSNFMSGGLKLLIASVIPKSNKWYKSVAMGFGIDGVEDVVVSILGGVPSGGGFVGEI